MERARKVKLNKEREPAKQKIPSVQRSVHRMMIACMQNPDSKNKFRTKAGDLKLPGQSDAVDREDQGPRRRFILSNGVSTPFSPTLGTLPYLQLKSGAFLFSFHARFNAPIIRHRTSPYFAPCFVSSSVPMLCKQLFLLCDRFCSLK